MFRNTTTSGYQECILLSWRKGRDPNNVCYKDEHNKGHMIDLSYELIKYIGYRININLSISIMADNISKEAI